MALEADIRTFLESRLPTAEGLQRTLADTAPDGVHPNRGWVYDADLGFVHANAIHSGDGVNGTNTFYTYMADGARRLVNSPQRPCRIHTYGDSFTHCDQVNDDETWQEAVSAHLQEPARNYGVGGYSVYQAYRRMRKVHDETARIGVSSAEYIILNIFDDDHYRNLVSWLRPPGRSSTLVRPHLRVNVGADTFVEHENPIPSGSSLEKLQDLDFVYDEFAEDPLVFLALATESDAAGEKAAAFLAGACERLGLPAPTDVAANLEAAVNSVFTAAALASTRHVVGLVERFCAENGIELMFVLSYGEGPIRSVLAGGERFDQEFVAWLKARGKPVVDMCETFNDGFSQSTVDLDTFVKRYYIGHHTPFGNSYAAWTLMDTLVNMLHPRPVSYQSGIGTTQPAAPFPRHA